jgi:hypothetical protein
MRRFVRVEYIAVVGLFLILTVMLTSLKVIRIDQLRGDSADVFQTTENIAFRGVPVSNVLESVYAYVFQSGLVTMSPEKMAKDPLAPPPVRERNLLGFHAYLILYPIAAFVRIVPVNVVLLTLDVVCFTGIVLLAYFLLRSRGIPIIAAAVFCLAIVSHPAWSEGLLSGQFYVDRLFILAGFIFMYLASRDQTPRPYLLAAAVVCMSINERASLTAGIFLLVYVALYWKNIKVDRSLKLGLSVAMLLYGWLIVKFVIGSNPYYSTFMPASLGEVMARFNQPAFAENAWLFILVNLPLLLIALFEPRAAAIAIIMLLPNVLGTIGGAEKVGWSTHYHASYFPALIWAALMGYVAAFRMVTEPKRLALFYAGIGAAIIYLSLLNPYSPHQVNFSPANIDNHFIFQFNREAKGYLSRAGLAFAALGDDARAAIPDGSVVSTIEFGMPLLYRNRTIEFLPVDIERADYAVLEITSPPGAPTTYGGVVSYLGPDVAAKVNDVIIERMHKDGYDFAHAKLVRGLGIAIVKRIH